MIEGFKERIFELKLLSSYLDADEAVEKATEFLEDHHNTIDLKSAELVNGIWELIFDVGFLNVQLKEVLVDGISGKIRGYTDAD